MRNKTDALLTIVLTLVVAVVAVSMAFPSHPRATGSAATAPEEATRAVLVVGGNAESGVSGGSECPYLAQKIRAGNCPGLQQQESVDAGVCPFAGSQPHEAAPHGKTREPQGPHT